MILVAIYCKVGARFETRLAVRRGLGIDPMSEVVKVYDGDVAESTSADWSSITKLSSKH
jgi:hypothetical protein